MKELINYVVDGEGDSDKHLLTLFGLALGTRGKTFIELGVRDGRTTRPLLMAANILEGTLHSVDVKPAPDIDLPQENWKFHLQDSIKFLESWDYNATIDFIYIDDWHSYRHVKRELEILDYLVSPNTVIVLHDLMYGNTCPTYHTDLTQENGQWAEGGPYRSVAELNPQFWEFATVPYGNGLTLLRKKYSSKFKCR